MKYLWFIQLHILFINLSYQLKFKLNQSIEQLQQQTYSCQDSDLINNIYQSNFSNGTLIIDQPGIYCLQEDIQFAPLNDIKNIQSLFKIPDKYDKFAFRLGFFCAVAITGSNIIFDLNKKVLQQSEEYALVQRFYSNIEVSDRPFVFKQGPFDFGPILKSATNVVIKNGIIGRSSHHGIHSNNNTNITINDILFRDFEVAAIALNGVKNALIKNIIIDHNKKNLPINFFWSNFINIYQYIEYLNEINSTTYLQIDGEILKINDLLEQMNQAYVNVIEDLMVKKLRFIDQINHNSEYQMFGNPIGVIEGNLYGILINQLGVATQDFPFYELIKNQAAENITIQNITINELLGSSLESISLVKQSNRSLMVRDTISQSFLPIQFERVQSVEQLFQINNQSSNGFYEGDLVRNAQAIVAKAYLENQYQNASSYYRLEKLYFPQEIINWIESSRKSEESKLTYLLKQGYSIQCNKDFLAHVAKGIIGIKFDGVKNGILENILIKNITGISPLGSLLCQNNETQYQYGGTYLRAISIAGSSNITLNLISMNLLKNLYGPIIGVDIINDSHGININDIQVNKMDVNLGLNEQLSKQTINPQVQANLFKLSPQCYKVNIKKRNK